MSADINFSHPHKAVHDAIFLYQVAIHYLLNNREDKSRANDAFEEVYNMSSGLGEYVSERDGTQQSCKLWLDLALELEKKANETGQLVISPLPVDVLNVRTMIGWL